MPFAELRSLERVEMSTATWAVWRPFRSIILSVVASMFGLWIFRRHHVRPTLCGRRGGAGCGGGAGGDRACCAADAARLRWVARLVEDCRAEVRERVLALGDAELDVDGEEFAGRMCVDTVMCTFGIGKNEAARLVNLADRLAVLPECGTPGRGCPGQLAGAGAGRE